MTSSASGSATRSPWVAVGVVLIGTATSTLNSNVVGVALPDIASDLSTESGSIGVDWVVTAYLIGVVLALPLIGWISDRAGRRAAYIGSLGLFAAGALICAVAPSMEALVAGRFVQGFGGGALMPLGMVIVYELFPPHRRGAALGVWGVASMAGPALGPPLGGWVLTAGSWRWIFGIFVIVAMVAALLAQRWLPDIGRRDARRLDLVGWLLTAVGVTGIVAAFRQLSAWGPLSPAILGTTVACAATFALLVRRSLRRADPIIEFRMFAVPTYSAAMVVGATALVCQTAYLTFLPIELQVVRDLDAQHVGLLLVPAAISTGALMTIAGPLVDHIGARVPVVIGFSAFAYALWKLAHLQHDSSTSEIVWVLMVQGAGLGLVFIPTQVAAMNSLPGRFVAQGSAMSHLLRQLSGALGIAFLERDPRSGSRRGLAGGPSD